MWYSYQDEPLKFIELKLDRVNEIVEMNNNGNQPNDLMDFVDFKEVVKEPDYANVVGQDSLTRFDNKKQGRSKKKRSNQNNKNRNRNNNRKKSNKKNNA